MAALKGDTESKEENTEALRNNPYIDENLIKAQKEYQKYEMHPLSKRILNFTDDRLLCMIRRDKAPNPVVYRARFKDGDISKGFADDPIEIFWLKIMKSNIRTHRDSGKVDDRIEVSYLESTMAYGLKYKRIGNKQEYAVTFVALPSWTCVLKICPTKRRPKLFGHVNGKECYLRDIHATLKKGKWFGIPRIDYITLKGYTCDDNSYVEHRINA